MKKIILLILACLLYSNYQGQEHFCAKAKQNSHKSLSQNLAKSLAVAAAGNQISHEKKYDVRFVNLNLNLERTNKFVSGGVKTVAVVTVSAMDTFQCLLHQNHIIDSVRFNGMLVTMIRQDSIIKTKIPSTLSNGSQFTVNVFYHGIPPNGGGAIGSGFSNGTSQSWGNQVTWSLSEAFVAYHWWPCKQELTDKIDSSWVFVTTDSTNKVGSNGILRNVVLIGNKKRYEWKSRYMIDYYLISVAIAKYKEYNLYSKPLYLPNDSILIQNYIYDGAINNLNWINQQKVELDKMPQVLAFESNMYGMYPFRKEKYGHCMAPFGGGMEHQTMTSLGFFDYYINAHELGHQWWGDNVTCKSWGDIWINEGFASYTEHLVAEYLDPTNFAFNLNVAHQNIMNQAGGSIFFSGADTLNSSRIFSSRLTYDKGGAIIHSLRFFTNNDSTWFNSLRGFQNTYKNSTASALDFQNYFQNFTGLNTTQFFSQWYYGQGYPTFNVKYNYTGAQCIIKSMQSVSMSNITPLFITPMEYRISRVGQLDTIIRVQHSQAVETYSINMTGTISSIVCDPNNWIINKVIGPTRDATLGIVVVPPPPVPDEISENTDGRKITISPNPTNGKINVESNNSYKCFVKVFDVVGKLVLEKVFAKNICFDLFGCQNGIYLVDVFDTSGNKIESQKVIFER